MDSNPIEADYLVVGTGASAMAFVDTLIDATDAGVVMVDRYAEPGGHWSQAYPFVRLHLPSAWYGVASRPLVGSEDPAGFGRGARGDEVLAYFGQLMRERLLPSGRVRWFPGCEYQRRADGCHRIVPLDGGEERLVKFRRKLVNATHARTEVASTHAPRYSVADGVDCIAPHRLPRVGLVHARHTVVGSGKTGMDACIWLLEAGIPAAKIRWIMPRDAWWLNRDNLLSGEDHFAHSIGSAIGEYEAIAEAKAIPDLLSGLEASGVLLRIDPAVQPDAYRCAIVAPAELAQLRRIDNIVRMGRVRSIQQTQVFLEQGVVAAEPDTLYIDCSAAGLQRAPGVPVFDGDAINLLMVSGCRPMFSAAVIAKVESLAIQDTEKNAMCTPTVTPERPSDWLGIRAVTQANARRWAQNPQLKAWLRSSRLDNVAVLMGGMRPSKPDQLALLETLGAKARIAGANLPRLSTTISSPDGVGPVRKDQSVEIAA